jgi:flagellar protein FliL
MPDKTSPESTSPPSGGPKRLITIGALCVLIAAGGYVLGGRMSGGAQPAGSAIEAPDEDAAPPIEAFVELDPLNVNLADGHYLRVAVAIGLTDVEEGDGHGDDDAPPIETAPASDLVLSTFLGRRMADLSTVAGRDVARHDLYEGLVDFYGDDIVSVLFTEFVMQ